MAALTVAELRVAVRAGSSPEETAILTRLLAVAQAHVTQHAPDAPEAVQNEAGVRIVGYLFDQPNAGRSLGYGNAIRNSGAAALLLPWRVHRAGSIGEAVEAAATAGTAQNPVIGLAIAGQTLTVTYADGTTADLTLPAGMAGAASGLSEIGEFELLDSAAAGTAAATGLTLPADAVYLVVTSAIPATGDVRAAVWIRAEELRAYPCAVGELVSPVEPDGYFVCLTAAGEILVSRGPTTPTTPLTFDQVEGVGAAGSGLTEGQVDARVAAGVEDWAETGNPDPIPAGKLANAPAGGAGLTEGQVDARVVAGVLDWAETGNPDPIPKGKLTEAGGHFRGIYSAATAYSAGDLVQFGVGSSSFFLSRSDANTGNSPPASAAEWVRVGAELIAEWAGGGNSDPIPADKLTNAPGLTLAEVNARAAAAARLR